MISEQRYSRHLKRCGTNHKKRSHVLDHPENFWMKIGPERASAVPESEGIRRPWE